MKKAGIFVFLLVGFKCFPQVGVGTNNPQETLHVNGTVRIDNTTSNNLNSIDLLGLDTNRTLNKIEVGQNLLLSNGILSAPSSPTGGTSYGIAIISDNFANQTLHNYDLDLDGDNLNKTVFIL